MGETGTPEPEKRSIRSRLLEAGLDLLADQGYRGATTREIASRAGVTEQTLFRHFGAKDALLREAVQHFTAPLKSLVPQPSGDLRQDLLTITREAATILEARQGLIARIMPEVSRIPDLIATTGKYGIPLLVESVAGLFSQYQVTHCLRDVAPQEMAVVFVGPLLLQTLLGGVWNITMPFDAERHVDGFLAGYQTDRG